MIQTFTEAAKASFDYSSLPFVERFPFTWFRQMRQEAPVFYDESLHAWSIFLYDDVQQALTNHAVFSSTPPDDPQNEARRFLTSDPPQHTLLRNSVNRAFTPRRIAALAPQIQRITNATLDHALAHSQVDIVDDIAYPIPATVISDLLGVPEALRPYLHSFLKEPDADFGVVEDVTLLPQEQIQQALASLIEERRRSPQEDMISALLQEQGEDHVLSDVEICNVCVSLYIAGHVTTADLIAHTFLCFAENPSLLERVRADMGLLPRLVEEVLRYYGTVLAFSRRITQDVTLRGQQLRAGDSVVLWFASANHDERVFSEPERLDIERPSNKHIAFGHGIHFCLGAPLARLEAPIVIQAMLERMDAIQFAPHEQLRRLPSWQFFSLEHLPITFTVRPSASASRMR